MNKVLIIDDEKSIRVTLKEVLSYEDYDVETASNGAEGVEKFKQDKYDAVLCDVKMPIMDGIETLDKLLEINPLIPVIMITGHGNVENAVKAIKVGACDYLEKPLDLNFLLITLRNAIEVSQKKQVPTDVDVHDYSSNSELESNILRSSLTELNYIYDTDGNKKSVVVPISLWDKFAMFLRLKEKQ
jgi:DNA-binding NtrC family response regulator